MTSRALKTVAGVLAVSGTTLAIVFLVISLRPKEKVPPKLPSLNIANLVAGQHATLDTDSMRYFVVYPLHGAMHVIAAPIDQGTVLMPDIHWWKPFANCKEFGLDTAAGAVTTESRFRCNDADQPAERRKQWQWDIYGRNIAIDEKSKTDNMFRVTFKRSGDSVVFTGLEPN